MPWANGAGGGGGGLGGNVGDLTKAALEEASALEAVVSWYRDVQRQQIDKGLAGDPVMFPTAPGHSRGDTGVSSPPSQSKAESVPSPGSSRSAGPPGRSSGQPLVSPGASRSAPAASDSGGEQSSWSAQGWVMGGTSLQSAGNTTVQVCWWHRQCHHASAFTVIVVGCPHHLMAELAPTMEYCC